MITRMSGKSGLEIAFPTHQGEYGTCDFMTKTCEKECPLWTSERDIASLVYFRSHSVEEIVTQLRQEIEQERTTVLSWFTEAGDCPASMTQKIASIIRCFEKLGVPQNGFTRNKKLWRMLNNTNGVNICLTEEVEAIAEELSSEGLVAVPNYKIRRVSINGLYMCGGGIVTTCGEGSVNTMEKEYEEDCSLCELRGIGCYGSSAIKKIA